MTLEAQVLLIEIESHGGRLVLKDGRVMVKGLKTLPRDLARRLRDYRTEIKAYLESKQRDESETPGDIGPEEACKTAQRTYELLSTRGWCLWKCRVLDGEVIAVARDENAAGVPQNYVIYTKAELENLFSGDGSVGQVTLRLIHQAKKMGAAVIGREAGIDQRADNSVFPA